VKIAYYLFFGSEGSGIAQYAHQLLQEIARHADCEPVLVCSPSYYGLQQSPAYAIEPTLSEIFHERRWRRRLRFVRGQVANPRRFAESAKRLGADMVHLFNINQISAPFWVSKLEKTGLPIALTIHDAYRNRGLVCPAYDNSQLSAVYRAADLVFYHADRQVEAIKARCPDADFSSARVPIGTFEYGPPTESREDTRSKHGIPQDKPVALFFGAVRDDKGLYDLLPALSGQGVHLVIAGKFNDRQEHTRAEYDELIRATGMENSVTMIDRFIDTEQIPNLFNMCDWVGLPYRKTFTSQSGVLAVAACYSKPILVTDVGALGETLERYRIGECVEAESPEALRAGVESMASFQMTPGDFERYRHDNSWEANAKISLDAYRECLSRQ